MHHRTIQLIIWLSSMFVAYDAASKPFFRSVGTLDFMDSFGWFAEGYHPLQLSPIYGHECVAEGCKQRRFLTVRMGNEGILELSNHWTESESNRPELLNEICSKNMLMMGLSCLDKNCVVPQLHCGTVSSRFTIVPSKNEVVQGAQNSSRVTCPNGMYVQALKCAMWDCNPVELYCVAVKYVKVPQQRHLLLTTGSRIMLGNEFSSAGTGVSQVMDGPVFSVECFRHSCQRIRLTSATRGERPLLGPVTFWTDYASDYGSAIECPPGTLVRQMKCVGEYCDKVYLGCARLDEKTGIQLDENDVRGSDIIGIYVPTIGYCPDGYYFKRLTCMRNRCSQLVIGCITATFIE